MWEIPKLVGFLTLLQKRGFSLPSFLVSLLFIAGTLLHFNKYFFIALTFFVGVELHIKYTCCYI